MQPPTTIHNHQQPSTITHNHPQPPTTIHNPPQPLRTTHNDLQPPTTTHNHPKIIKKAKTFHKQSCYLDVNTETGGDFDSDVK